MVNRFEAIGIFVSVTLMAVALFFMNMETATNKFDALQGNLAGSAAVIMTDEDPRQALYDAVDATGNVQRLIIDDVVVGSGKEVIAGDRVAVHYIGTLQNGQAFDNSYTKGEPFQFKVGSGEVIAGWDQGILGMKRGGQRILVIPAALAYGDRVVGPIPANSTLVFAVELVEIVE